MESLNRKFVTEEIDSIDTYDLEGSLEAAIKST